MDTLVGAHLQALADRVDGLLRPDGQHGDLGALVLLLELERLLDRVLVELRQQPVDTNPVNGVVILEVPVPGRVRNVIHTTDNVHGSLGPEGPS